MGILRKAALRVLGKRSSSKTASLAANYIGVTPGEVLAYDIEDARRIAKDIRSLAASVLSQKE